MRQQRRRLALIAKRKQYAPRQVYFTEDDQTKLQFVHKPRVPLRVTGHFKTRITSKYTPHIEDAKHRAAAK